MFCKQELLISDLRVFHTILMTLLIIGLLFVYSSSSVYALATCNDAHYFLKKQLVGLAIGFFAFCIIQIMPTSVIKKSTYFFLAFATIVTAGTLFPNFSRHINGSSRWLLIGSFSFQPSELIKIGVVLSLARLFSQQIKMVSYFNRIAVVCAFILISGILLKQPDFGLTMTLWVVSILLFFITYGYMFYLASMLLMAIPGIGFMIIRYPYRLQRILTFLNPWNDAKGTGFQIIQSLIAIGSGGLCGTGIGHSKQKLFYLPMQHTDFIFSIIAEETGFIGSISIIILFLLFLYFGLKIAHQLRDPFCHLATCGFTILITLQAAINLAVCTGVVPTKGIGLPFISYGNSALIATIIMIGIITNFAHQNPDPYQL